MVLATYAVNGVPLFAVPVLTKSERQTGSWAVGIFNCRAKGLSWHLRDRARQSSFRAGDELNISPCSREGIRDLSDVLLIHQRLAPTGNSKLMLPARPGQEAFSSFLHVAAAHKLCCGENGLRLKNYW